MKLRTQTRPNGRDNVRDFVMGLDMIGPFIALGGLGLTILGMGVSFANHLDDKLTLIQRELSTTKQVAESTADEMKRRITAADDTHKGFVTKDQYDYHNHAGRVPAEGGR
jgi:hypothetical protein